MGWLLRQGMVLASLEVTGATTRAERRPSAVIGAELRSGTRVVVGRLSKGAGDLAWLDGDLVVREIGQIGPFGVKLRPRGCATALVADRGAFERWRLELGDQLEIRE